MLSYLNDKSLKKDMIDEMKLHEKQDALIKGVYSKINGNFKGCAVGCGVDSLNRKRKLNLKYNNHATYSEALGIPEWLAMLEDAIFEGLEDDESKKFPVEFLKSIPVGVDLEIVQFKFKKFLLIENHKTVSKLKNLPDSLRNQVLKSIDLCLDIMDGAIKTGKIDESAAESAESAAWSAAESAESAAESAESAAWSAESAARSAAESAESAARSARSAAWSAAFSRYKKELLRLLKDYKNEGE